ncbi:hypothetical protein [Symbioplanes lichenis]|uniref:hypothetical protein n=1 Tax=Symbioplanes lichenis TaxID=1629072 RepID=UPI0027383822|nr:hypothetical protein [Actinoplanes lichenis]
MTYGIYFASETPGESLRQALHDLYEVPPSLVYVGPYEALNDHPGPDPIALITPREGPFGQELSGSGQLGQLVKVSPLELARALCRAARTRALMDEGGPAPDYWFLVTADGSYGRVMTDPDSDDLTILHAMEPIAGAPELAVVPPPDWARTW